MKAHPRSAVLHVRLERGPLRRIFWTGIQKHHDLVLRENALIELAPIGRRIEAEVVLRRGLRKPPNGFVDKADVRLVFLRREERKHAKRPRAIMSADRSAPTAAEQSVHFTSSEEEGCVPVPVRAFLVEAHRRLTDRLDVHELPVVVYAAEQRVPPS